MGNLNAVITAACRTPIGTAGGSLRGYDAAALAAPVLSALASLHSRTGRTGGRPDEVLLGNCMGPGGDVARVATLASDLPDDTPAVTVDRQCASGLAAIGLGAALVRSGSGSVIAGGVESASTAPLRFWRPEPGVAEPVPYERAPFAPAGRPDPEMGAAADALAASRGISREAQDVFAARSHQRAWSSSERGIFDDELVTLDEVRRDERPRAGLGVERLTRLRPAFGAGGTATAGNSSGVNDGAAAVSIHPDGPGLRVLSVASAGVDPALPGLGIVPATRIALDRAGLRLDDLGVIEFNEAFAGQILACCADLDLDPERVCPQGGAIGLGHPWGASGAVLAVRLFGQLMGGSERYGLAAIAAGGGQGTAMVVEACR